MGGVSYYLHRHTSSILSMKILLFAMIYMQGMKKLEDIFNHEGKAVDDLLNIAKVFLILGTGGLFLFFYFFGVFLFFCLFCLFACFFNSFFFFYLFFCFVLFYLPLLRVAKRSSSSPKSFFYPSFLGFSLHVKENTLSIIVNFFFFFTNYHIVSIICVLCMLVHFPWAIHLQTKKNYMLKFVALLMPYFNESLKSRNWPCVHGCNFWTLA